VPLPSLLQMDPNCKPNTWLCAQGRREGPPPDHLKRTEGVTPAEAAKWCLEARDKFAREHGRIDCLAFIAHRFMAARASAFEGTHSPSSKSFSPSSRNATLVSFTFCGEIPSAGATSTRSVSFKPAVVANFESTFV
jgi:hypothetical protein